MHGLLCTVKRFRKMAVTAMLESDLFSTPIEQIILL